MVRTPADSGSLWLGAFARDPGAGGRGEEGGLGSRGCPPSCLVPDGLSGSAPLQTMDREFRKWMKWYGKKHAEYTVSATAPCPVAAGAVPALSLHPRGRGQLPCPERPPHAFHPLPATLVLPPGGPCGRSENRGGPRGISLPQPPRHRQGLGAPALSEAAPLPGRQVGAAGCGRGDLCPVRGPSEGIFLLLAPRSSVGPSG